MIQITPQMRILVAVESFDFRNGIDGLARICAGAAQGGPVFGMALCLSQSRRRTAIKVLVYDGQGFWLMQKRLSTGRFRCWPRGRQRGVRASGGPPAAAAVGGWQSGQAVAAPPWRRVSPGV